MRLGLISDIHADLDGLMAALTVLHNLGVDHILCAGDLVEKGKQGDTVVAILRARQISCVRGNHDEMAVDNQAWLRANGDPDNPNFHQRVLSDSTLEFLRALPFDRRFAFGAMQVLLTHGTPHSNIQYLYPNSSPNLFRQVSRDAYAEVVILGHTHKPMRVCVDGVVIVNPGSICEEGSRTCAVLELPAGSLEVYNLATGSHMPDSDFRSFLIE